jgi:hypothetical protein
MVIVPSDRDLRRVVNTLRRIIELTEGLPYETPKDLVLQDRLEMAAKALDTVAFPHPGG